MKRMNKKGFTIVELVIVVAIVAILAAVLIPTFASIIKKANVSKDTQLIRNLNTALKADVKGQKNMTEALEAAAAFGYDVSKINASATDNEILWDSVNNVFCYFNNAKGQIIEYIPEFPAKTTVDSNHKYWKIYNKTGEALNIESNAYSAYLGPNFDSFPNGAGVVTVTGIGVDVGERDDITTINYSGTAGHTVIIRTDSAETTLNINSASDTIHHYDLVGDVNVVKTADASYHEFGKAGYVQVASGRVVAENGGYINTVVLTEKGDATKVAIIEERGTGKFENKFATTNAVAGWNNADDKSVKLTLRTGDTDETKGDILLAMAQQELTGDALAEAVTAATTETKRAAIASVTPDPYANAPADAYYAYVDEASGDIYYSLAELEVAYAGNQYRIVLLQDATNAFEFINDSTFTFDLNGHHLDLHGGDGFGVVASHVTIVDSKATGKISTPEFGVMGDASLTIESGTIVFDDPDYPYCFGGFMAMLGYGGPTTITGGTFNVDPTGNLASGYSAAEVDGVWTVYKN